MAAMKDRNPSMEAPTETLRLPYQDKTGEWKYEVCKNTCYLIKHSQNFDKCWEEKHDRGHECDDSVLEELSLDNSCYPRSVASMSYRSSTGSAVSRL